MQPYGNSVQSTLRWLVIGTVMAGAGTTLSASTLEVDGGILEIGGGAIEAGAFVLGADAELRGVGEIRAPATLAGRIVPSAGGAQVGTLTFTDLITFNGAVYVCHVQTDELLSLIAAAGDVTGDASVELIKPDGVIPLWQVIIDGGAGSDFSQVSAAAADDWRLDSTGAVSLLVTDLRGDSNTNALPDWWEMLYFGGRTAADPEGDADADGFKNLHEYLAGTDPLDPESLLKMAWLGLEGDDLDLHWLSVPGKQYRIDGRASFETGDWEPLTPDAPLPASATEAFTVWRHPNAPSPYYYRIRLD